MEYIEIDKDQVPYRFEINLEEETFQFDINYNEVFDFFTVDLYKDHELIILGEKVVYGSPLFGKYTHLDIPRVFILPHDTTNNPERRVGFDELEEDIFLFIASDEDVD